MLPRPAACGRRACRGFCVSAAATGTRRATIREGRRAHPAPSSDCTDWCAPDRRLADAAELRGGHRDSCEAPGPTGLALVPRSASPGHDHVPARTRYDLRDDPLAAAPPQPVANLRTLSFRVSSDAPSGTRTVERARKLDLVTPLKSGNSSQAPGYTRVRAMPTRELPTSFSAPRTVVTSRPGSGVASATSASKMRQALGKEVWRWRQIYAWNSVRPLIGPVRVDTPDPSAAVAVTVVS